MKAKDLKEARSMAEEELLAQEQAAAAEETPPEDVPEDAQPSPEGEPEAPAEEQAVSAEPVAEPSAPSAEEQLQAMAAENQALTEQIAKQNQLIEEQSAMLGQRADGPVMEPSANQEQGQAMSNEEFLARFYDDPRGAIAELVNGEVGGIKQQYQAQNESRQWQQAISRMEADTENFPGFAELQGTIGAIAEKNPALKDPANKEQSLVNLYYIARGIASGQQPRQPSPEELLADDDYLAGLVDKNPELVKKITLIQAQKAPNADVPPMSASAGAVNAAPNVYKQPRDMRDADEQARKRLGL